MADDGPKRLLYLCYGDGPHVAETLFSILTLRRFPAPALRGAAVRLITDRPDLFEPHGIDVVPVAAATIAEWQGPTRFLHRCKILAMKSDLERSGGRCILVDGDTYFRRPPEGLFRRVGPGRSLLYRVEGALGHSRHEFNHRLAAVLEERPPGYHPAIELARGAATVQWNAGVVGLDGRDVGLLDEVLGLMDYLRGRAWAPVLEQLAFSVVLGGRTRLQPARDVVFHYCATPRRAGFRAGLPGLLAESAGMAPAERARWLYARRLRPGLSVRARNLVKDVLHAAGIVPPRDRAECC